MAKTMDTKYDHLAVEKDIYSKWVEKGYFTAGDLTKKPYCIVIPPPNVTGKLHLGHAWDTTLQDILCRYKRLKGYDVLWVSGMDHAGIATQAKVDERLKNEGISRYDIGREKFLDRAWEWKEEYASTIRSQWAKLGLSLDYTRERFTLDEGLSKAVRKVFVDLYNDGLIYQGERIINWDPEAKTALSNIEVEHKEILGHMYYFKYKVVENGQELVIATTRPETMFADQAIFVHPEDERYKEIVGMHAINPANGDELPIIADSYIDIEFGTGAMKCTPAHDPNDFALAKKYGLKMPICMNPDGTMNEMCHKYAGMDRFECREALVEDFKKAGVVDHIEEHMHQVGHSERTGVIVEPYLSKQWFVKMKPLAEEVLRNQKIEDQKIHFVPSRFEKTFEQWLENIEDWCISRQRYFGVPFPVWYCKKCGKPIFAEESQLPVNPLEQSPLKACTCGCNEFIPETAVFDTWATSSVTPLINAHYKETDDISDEIFPMGMRSQAHEIIRTWAFYTIVKSLYHTGQVPWKDIMISGFVLAKPGEKISKSKNNASNSPMMLIEKHSADAMRYWAANSKLGTDTFFSEEELKISKRFLNKLYNASKFAILQLNEFTPENAMKEEKMLPIDRWIMERVNETTIRAAQLLNEFEIGQARHEIDELFWSDFCDFYIEIAKERLYQPQKHGEENCRSGQTALYYSLLGILKLYAIYTPYMTDYIFQEYYRQYEKEISLHQTIWQTKTTQTEYLEFGEHVKATLTQVRKDKTQKQMSMKDPIEKLTITCPKAYREFYQKTLGDLYACTAAEKIQIRS